MKDYAKKGYKIAIFAMVLALLAFSTGSNTTTNNFYNNSTCLNCSNFSDNTKINKTGDIVGNSFRLNNTGYMWYKAKTDISLMTINTIGDYGLIDIYNDTILFNIYNNTNLTNRNYWFDDDGLYLGGRSLTGCSNCVNSTQLNEKVNKSGDTITGTLNMSNNSIININNISLLSDFGTVLNIVNETGGVTGSASETGYILWARFNSSQTYNSSLLSLNIYSYIEGANMRMSVYNGNGSNKPITLLSESASQAITSTGWNNISYPTIQINGSNTEYYIAMQTQNAAVVYYSAGTGTYKAQAYGSFPSSAGTTSYTDAINMRIYGDVGGAQKRYCVRVTHGGTLYTIEC